MKIEIQKESRPSLKYTPNGNISFIEIYIHVNTFSFDLHLIAY